MEKNFTECYMEIFKLIESTMKENKMPLWFFDVYLPKFYTERMICMGLKFIEKERRINYENSNNEE